MGESLLIRVVSNYYLSLIIFRNRRALYFETGSIQPLQASGEVQNAVNAIGRLLAERSLVTKVPVHFPAESIQPLQASSEVKNAVQARPIASPQSFEFVQGLFLIRRLQLTQRYKDINYKILIDWNREKLL